MRVLMFFLAIGLTVATAVAAESQDEGHVLLRLNGHTVKWGEPDIGTGAAVKYAFARTKMAFPLARNCKQIGPLQPALAKARLGRQELRRETEAAFAIWRAAANLKFKEVDDPADADIVIGAQIKPRGIAFTNVEFKPGPGGGTKSIDKALICLNPNVPWQVGFDGDLDTPDLRYTLAHEIGHTLGLDHAGPEGQLMSFKYTEKFRKLRPGDRAGIVSLYGPKPPFLAGAATFE